MTIQALKHDLTELKKAIKPNGYQIVVLLHDRTGKVVSFNGVDMTGCTQEEIDKKLENFSVVLHLPEKNPYPGE
jgi:hypothetical protein